MPYKSDAQRRFFHTDTARRAGITPAMVQEFDMASRGERFPEKKAGAYGVPSMPTAPKAPTPNVRATPQGAPPLTRTATPSQPVNALARQSMQRGASVAATNPLKVSGPASMPGGGGA